MNKVLALFDFDGTLTQKDSFIRFIFYACGRIKSLFGLAVLSPVIFLYKIGLIKNDKAKTIVFSYFFRNWSLEEFQSKADDFGQYMVPTLLRKEALDKLSWHKQSGHQIAIVTASFENWIQKWAEEKDVKLIGSELEIINGKISGKIKGKNCYGPVKVEKLITKINLSEYSIIYAYGDSAGDKEMLDLAHHKFYCCF